MSLIDFALQFLFSVLVGNVAHHDVGALLVSRHDSLDTFIVDQRCLVVRGLAPLKSVQGGPVIV